MEVSFMAEREKKLGEYAYKNDILCSNNKFCKESSRRTTQLTAEQLQEGMESSIRHATGHLQRMSTDTSGHSGRMFNAAVKDAARFKDQAQSLYGVELDVNKGTRAAKQKSRS
jgi:hypothetical protein